MTGRDGEQNVLGMDFGDDETRVKDGGLLMLFIILSQNPFPTFCRKGHSSRASVL